MLKGGVKVPESAFYRIDLNGMCADLYYNIHNKTCELIIGNEGIVIKNCQYLHKLQNIVYSLTGQELQFKKL